MKNTLLTALIPNFSNVFIWLNAIIMLFGVFYLGWKPEVVVIAYFLETIIIGVLHVFKMLIVFFYSDQQKFDVPTPSNTITGFVVIPFFIFHYFFFIFVQSVFIFVLLNNLLPKSSDAFSVFSNYAYLLSQHDILMAFLTLAFTNVAITLKDFILPRKYKKATISKMFSQPYLRIFIQQFVTIIAGFLAIASNGTVLAAIMIISFRLVTDLFIIAATEDADFKTLLINKIKKSQKPEDEAKIEESINSFLEK